MKLKTIIIVVLILFLSNITIIFFQNKLIQKQQNKMLAYSYLSNYHCWIDTFKTTLYTLHWTECSKKKSHLYYGITRSGTRAVSYRTVAVDPDVIPLGSILIDVLTGKKYVAEDTGNKIKGRMVDIFVGFETSANRKKANDWGVKEKTFIVIE